MKIATWEKEFSRHGSFRGEMTPLGPTQGEKLRTTPAVRKRIQMKFSIARSHSLARTATRLFPNGLKLMGLFAMVAAFIPAAQASCGDLAGLTAPFQFMDASAQARSMQDDEVARSRGGDRAASTVG